MISLRGQKSIGDEMLSTPSGQTAALRTIWILDASGDTPRSVTAYPLEAPDD